MPDNEVLFAGGKASSSKCSPYHLIPTEGNRRIADRFQLGIDNRPDGTAWNACSQNQECLLDIPFVMSRITHVMEHAQKLRDKIVAGEPMDGDDDAAAIGWAAHFLCCATRAMQDQKNATIKNCSACGGDGYSFECCDTGMRSHGKSHDEGKCSGRVVNCYACHGTGKEKSKKT